MYTDSVQTWVLPQTLVWFLMQVNSLWVGSAEFTKGFLCPSLVNAHPIRNILLDQNNATSQISLSELILISRYNGGDMYRTFGRESNAFKSAGHIAWTTELSL